MTQPPTGPGPWPPQPGGWWQPGGPTAALPGQPGYGGGPTRPGPSWSPPPGPPAPGGPPAGPGGGPPRWVAVAVGVVLVLALVVVAGALVVRGRGGDATTATTATTTTAAPGASSPGPGSSSPGSSSPGPSATRTRGSAPPSAGAPVFPGQVAGPGAQVTYEVSGTATGVSLVLTDEAGAISTVDAATLPYTSSFTAGNGFLFPTVTATGRGGSLTCRITVDGAVVAEQTGSGELSLAVCTAF